MASFILITRGRGTWCGLSLYTPENRPREAKWLAQGQSVSLRSWPASALLTGVPHQRPSPWQVSVCSSLSGSTSSLPFVPSTVSHTVEAFVKCLSGKWKNYLPTHLSQAPFWPRRVRNRAIAIPTHPHVSVLPCGLESLL